MRTGFGVKTAEVSTSLAGVSVENGDLLLARVQITSDEGHDPGLLFLRAAALGLSEANSSARPFS
jgi:hypothetical protein